MERKEINKRYRVKHKIKIKESNKQYNLKNKKEIDEHNKQYRIEQKEEIKKRNEQWNINNKEYSKTYYKNNKEKFKQDFTTKMNKRNLHLKRKYNITQEQYNELFNKQNGKCAICGKHQSELKKALGIDHDHETGKNRGLLCDKCNLLLGHANDNVQVLTQAINYLNIYNIL
jgi:hypothetical protein